MDETIKKLWLYLTHFKNALLPYTCLLCRAYTNRELALCYYCEQDLPRLSQHCQQCASELALPTQLCGSCLHEPPLFHTVIALGNYRPPLTYLIARLKFGQQLACAQLLSELLLQTIKQAYQHNSFPEYIIPVPLHSSRLRTRGFNQALEIAKPIASDLKIPLLRYQCLRVKPTQAQSLLPLEKRQANLKNAFLCSIPLTAKHVAILDDVVTSGQTANQLTMSILAAGASRVDVWCVARTQLSGGVEGEG